METTRNEKIIACVAIAAVAAFFVLFQQVSTGSKSNPEFDSKNAIDYRMARPEQVYSEYTLEGRELDQSYEALKREEAKQTQKKQEALAKKKTEEKKKEDAKKSKSIAGRLQQQLQNAKAQFEQKFLEAKEAIFKAHKQSESVSEVIPYNNATTTAEKANAQAAEIPTKDTKKTENKKTFAEWRALLFASPTSENLGLFVAAFRKNEVTATEYQAMAQDLIEQSDVKLKGLGLAALRSAPSLASLSQLVHLDISSLSTEYQAYVEQSINSYSLPQNLQFLNQGLLTQDKTLISKCLNLLNVNLTKLNQGDMSGFIDPRDSRSTEVATLTLSQYQSLLPALTELGQSGDQELSGLAQQVASLISSTNNVAQN